MDAGEYPALGEAGVGVPLFDDDFAYGLRDAKVILTDYRYVRSI